MPQSPSVARRVPLPGPAVARMPGGVASLSFTAAPPPGVAPPPVAGLRSTGACSPNVALGGGPPPMHRPLSYQPPICLKPPEQKPTAQQPLPPPPADASWAVVLGKAPPQVPTPAPPPRARSPQPRAQSPQLRAQSPAPVHEADEVSASRGRPRATTLQDVQARLEAESNLLSCSVQELRDQQVQSIQAMNERIDLTVGQAMEAISSIPSGSEVLQTVNALSRRMDERLSELEARLEAGFRDACRMTAGACEARLVPLEQQVESGRRFMEELEERIVQVAEAIGGSMSSADGQMAAKDRREVLRAVSAVCSDVEVLRESCNRNAGSVEEIRNQLSAQVPQEPRGLKELEERLRGDFAVLQEQQLRARSELAALRSQPPGGGCVSQEVWSQLASTARAAVQSELTTELRALQSRLASDIQALQEQQVQFGSGLEELQCQQAAGTEALRLLQELSLRQGGELEALKSVRPSAAEELPEQHGDGGGTGNAPAGGLLPSQTLDHELEALKSEVGTELEELRGQQQELAGALQDLRGQLGSNMEALQATGGAEEAEAFKDWVLDEVRSLQSWQSKSGEELETIKASFADEIEALRARTGRSTEEVQELWRAQGVMTEALRGQLARELEVLHNQQGQSAESLGNMQRLHGSAIDSLRKQQAGLAEVIKDQMKSELEAIVGPKDPENEGLSGS